MSTDTITVLDLPVSVNPLVSISSAFGASTGGATVSAMCINPHSYIEALRDPEFFDALKNASLLLCDGVGIHMASIILNGLAPSRVTGSDCFDHVNRLGSVDAPLRLFLLGSTESVLEHLINSIHRDYPLAKVVGTYSPPFDNKLRSQTSDIIETINASNADVLWVGMTAPKQELWVHGNIERINVRFIGCIGAVFDFHSGVKPRPSVIFRTLGFEWLGRLLFEPRRVWRRTVVSAPLFVFYVILALCRKVFKRRRF